MSRHFLSEMTWREAEARRRRADIAIVPVGSNEIHGPHLLLGCDSYIAEALALEVARRVGAVITPTISLTYSGGTKPFTGSISISLSLMTGYLKAVCYSLIEQGFRRTLIVQWHAPYISGQQVTRDIFGESGVPVLFYGPCVRPEVLREVFEEEDGAYVEASLLLGALRLLGKEELLDLSGIKDEDSVPRPDFLDRISASGAWTGHYYDHETQHVPPRAHPDAERGARAIASSAEIIAGVADDWAKYVRYCEEQHKGGWFVRD